MVTDLLQKQIAIDPSFFGTHRLLGSVYLEQEKWSEAIAEFEAAKGWKVAGSMQ